MIHLIIRTDSVEGGGGWECWRGIETRISVEVIAHYHAVSYTPTVSIETEEPSCFLAKFLLRAGDILHSSSHISQAEAGRSPTRNQCAQIGGSGQRNCIPCRTTLLPV
jgi:hypothetical protein